MCDQIRIPPVPDTWILSRMRKFVLLEVYNEDTKENDCKKGVQFIKRKRDISKTPPTH